VNLFSDYTSITLNGTFLKGAEIEDFCKRQNSDFFLHVASFMNEWLNPNSYISLKTSGSTGAPKTILIEKNKMLFSAARTAEYFNFKKGQKALLCLPINYIAGKMMLVRALVLGWHLDMVNSSAHPLDGIKNRSKSVV